MSTLTKLRNEARNDDVNYCHHMYENKKKRQITKVVQHKQSLQKHGTHLKQAVIFCFTKKQRFAYIYFLEETKN